MTKLIRPLFYHWSPVSDCKWIIQKMKVIPESRRREVANHYENLFLRNEGGTGRDDANKYLKAVASEYRQPVERKEQKTKRSFEIKKPPVKKYNSDCGLWKKKLT